MQKHQENDPFVILVEGNIGCGKSTLLKHFSKFEDVSLIYEPLEKWQNVGGYNLLDLFYKNPERWGPPTQNYITLTMLEGHLQPTHKKFKIMERSIYSSRYCFINCLLEDGHIDEQMYRVLLETHNLIEKSFRIDADLIVYLQTTPKVVYDRIMKRSRAEESTISMEYLQNLHKHHERWLIEKNTEAKSMPIYVVDANPSAENMILEYEKIEKMFKLS